MTDTDEIKNRLDIVDVISETVPLRRSGRSYTGFCPFHPNTRTPAFAVFPDSQTWRCFGACAEGGDVFSFVMKKQGWDFKEALAHLAERAGVTLEERGPADKKLQQAEDRLTDLLEAAADYYMQILQYAPQAEHVRHYVQDRGLSQETLETFKIGFALNSWDAAHNHFNMQGYGDDDLIDAGLLTVNEEKGTRYDRFRNRLMIPIRNVAGKMVGFGARTLDPDGLPKYLNSPQTVVFDKSRLLYGLDLARRHIREARQAVIVEGYMDVMQAWQAGFTNVVAQMGTALTGEQLRLLKRYTKRFVLALDADAAGDMATLRSLEVAREVLDREPDIRFDARGLVRHEGRLQADIRVVTLPEGNDPDKIIRADPQMWPQLIDQAKPVVAYVIDAATAGLDMDDAKAKTAVARQILPLIDDIVDPLEREHYRQMLARSLRVDERALRKVTVPSTRRRSTAPATRSTTGPPTLESRGDATTTGVRMVLEGSIAATDMRRNDFLRQCLSYPQVIPKIKGKLEGTDQPTISDADFSRPDDRVLWRRMVEQADRWPVATIEELCDSLDDELLLSRVQLLLTLPKTDEEELERLPDRLVLSVLDWRLERVKSLLGEVKQLFFETQTENNPALLELYSKQLRELPLEIKRINRARGAITSAGK